MDEKSKMGRKRKYGGAEISAKAHLSAQIIFLPSFPSELNHGDQSNPVKVGQTDAGKG
jgi:hypothetical protein